MAAQLLVVRPDHLPHKSVSFAYVPSFIRQFIEKAANSRFVDRDAQKILLLSWVCGYSQISSGRVTTFQQSLNQIIQANPLWSIFFSGTFGIVQGTNKKYPVSSHAIFAHANYWCHTAAFEKVPVSQGELVIASFLLTDKSAAYCFTGVPPEFSMTPPAGQSIGILSVEDKVPNTALPQLADKFSKAVAVSPTGSYPGSGTGSNIVQAADSFDVVKL